MKGINELTRFVKRELKEAKENQGLSKNISDRNYYEGRETAFRDIVIKLELLKQLMESESKLSKERKSKKALFSFLVGTLVGGTILTLLTYLIFSIIQ